MKKLLLSFFFVATLFPVVSIASDFMILVGTDLIPEDRFEPWQADDPTSYSGIYAGDIGGDSTGRLEVTVDGKREAMSGTYELLTPGIKPEVNTPGFYTSRIRFENMYRFDSDHTVEDRYEALVIRFVRLDGQEGCIVGRAFIPREIAE